MLPVVAVAARALGAGVLRSSAVLGRSLALATTRLGALAGRMVGRLGTTARAMFTARRGKAPIKVNAKRALQKLDRFEKIIYEVLEDAEPIMKSHTAMALKSTKYHKKGNAKRNTKYNHSKKQLEGNYEYASYIDVPNFQKNNVTAEGRKYGITKPTEKWIRKEILKRVKKELGR